MIGKRDLKDGFIRADEAFDQNLLRMLTGYRSRHDEKRIRPLRLVLVTALMTMLLCGALFVLAGPSGALDFLFSPKEDFFFTYVTSYRSGVKGWVITGYYGQETNIVIPEKIGSVPVSGIGAGAFARRGEYRCGQHRRGRAPQPGKGASRRAGIQGKLACGIRR